MVKLLDEVATMGPLDASEAFFEIPPQSKKLGNFVLDQNGQINIDRKGIDGAYGFRLQEINHNTEICSNKDLCDETTTSVSGYSNYKQRIDAMFDDSRSLISEMSKDFSKEKRGSKSLLDVRTNLTNRSEKRKERTITNNIQEKIEKMFEDITVQGVQRSTSFGDLRNRGKEGKSVPAQVQGTLSHNFKVIYLGAKPLLDKTVSLISLQDPLKELYFEYKMKRDEDEVNTLSISKDGLKIKTADKEHLNAFPTIAVWASVKLAFRNGTKNTEFAFLPLIKDPDGIDKNVLFTKLEDKDRNLVFLNGDRSKIDESMSSPIFTVVMKNNELNKQLECHGFICTSSEEAIIIAANLYQALMKKMKKKKESKKEMKLYEGVSEKKGSETGVSAAEAPTSTSKSPPPVPKRPPRKDKKSSDGEDVSEPEVRSDSAVKNEKIKGSRELIKELEMAFDEILKQEKTDSKVQRRGSVPTNVYTVEREPLKTLRRTASERVTNGIAGAESSDRGDILTKVAIPRSRSFLNANGPLTRYSRRYKPDTQNAIESPLGFTELFNEFRQNEGLESMDDILNAIIDAEGMSFNDLKPIYKEFLLKLAAALTKDELYQRSKIIMRRQKKKNRSRKKAFISTTRLTKVFKKTASKLGKSKCSRPTNLEFTSIIFPSGKTFETSTSSASSFREKPKFGGRRRQSTRRRLNRKQDRKKSKPLSATSEESDFFSQRNPAESGGCPNRSSSGYFSCSECSYDSENCTCTSADKCYCTLGQNHIRSAKFFEKDKSNSNLLLDMRYKESSLQSCTCDTDSCANSDKCYCSVINRNVRRTGSRSSSSVGDISKKRTKILNLSDVSGAFRTSCPSDNGRTHCLHCPSYLNGSCRAGTRSAFQRLKENGFAASDSSLSRAASPSTAWRNNEERTRKPKEGLKESTSLEFLQLRSSENHRQMKECPSHPRLPADHCLLKEIQNTSHQTKFVEGTRHFCYHGSNFSRSRRVGAQPNPSISSPRLRQYSSVRLRNDSHIELSQTGTSRTRSIFSSIRSRSSCDSWLSQVKFPNATSRNNSLRFARRMDVYDSFGKRGKIYRYEGCPEAFVNGRRKVTEPSNENHGKEYVKKSSRSSVRNGRDQFRKLNYDLFMFGKSETSDVASHASDRKVLVVSARDPSGKVLYMGASTRGENTGKRFGNVGSYMKNSSGNACEALSVKKSAEIAALFADVSSKTKLHRTGQLRCDKYVGDCKDRGYRSSNMENTLGYLP